MTKRNLDKEIKEYNFFIDLFLFMSLILLTITLVFGVLDKIIYNIDFDGFVSPYNRLLFGAGLFWIFGISFMNLKNHVRLKKIEEQPIYREYD